MPRFFPTLAALPVWCRPLSIPTVLTTLRISEPRVRLVSPRFVKERGLARSLYMPRKPRILDPVEIIESLKAEAPVDGVEVVEWMQLSAAENAVLSARMEEYNRLGSQIVSGSTDSYIPGLIVEDCRVRSERGYTVGTRGFAIAETPRGDFNIPRLRRSTGIFRDLITWASMYYQATIQHCETLLKWKSLAQTPIRQTVGFYMDSRGNAAPNFFVQQPPRPALTVRVRQRFSSNVDQRLTLNFRDPTDYTRVAGSRNVDIAAGENEVTYTFSAFPYCPPVIAEIQPQDGAQTKLDLYEVS